MADRNDYFAQKYRIEIEKLRSIQQELPEICSDFFRAIEPTTSILTRLNYAYDLRLFFGFLSKQVHAFNNTVSTQIKVDDLNRVTSTDLEKFLEYISFYEKDNLVHENHENGKARKLATLRSFYAYLFKKKLVLGNIASLLDMPKIHEKEIIRMEVDEVAKLLDQVESGNSLTKTQKKYHEYTRLRDIALLTLFLGTGIRISECIGLDINHLDFEINGFKITRKGGNQVILYFSDEVRNALLQYLKERKIILALPSHENALFLSLQKKRISAKAIQNLVKKYSQIITPLKRITPHKLRSTYGTTLYRETGDIYLVADVLGHKDVNTTRKHYAAISEDKRRMAAKIVKLRDDSPIE